MRHPVPCRYRYQSADTFSPLHVHHAPHTTEAFPTTFGAGGGSGAGGWNLGFASASRLGNTAAAGPARCWMKSYQRSRLQKCSVCASGNATCLETQART
eukprot:366378-Chlamydomonas_euryale.AAC.15